MKRLIEPIGPEQERLVREETERWIRRAEEICRIDLSPIPVLFDLRGRAAGMYRVRGGRRTIRYNPHLFAKYFRENLATTVPHEVAHYAADLLHGWRNIRPHGPEWQSIMRAFGIDPRATGQYDLTGIPVRRQRRFTYHCGCRTHLLSTCRHNRVMRGEAVYFCNRCGEQLNFPGDPAIDG